MIGSSTFILHRTVELIRRREQLRLRPQAFDLDSRSRCFSAPGNRTRPARSTPRAVSKPSRLHQSGASGPGRLVEPPGKAGSFQSPRTNLSEPLARLQVRVHAGDGRDAVRHGRGRAPESAHVRRDVALDDAELVWGERKPSERRQCRLRRDVHEAWDFDQAFEFGLSVIRAGLDAFSLSL
jgi:hypothetical protein